MGSPRVPNPQASPADPPPLPRRQPGRRPSPVRDDAVTRHRAGQPRRTGRTTGPAGPFVLAPGLAAPGKVPIGEAVALAAAELDRQAAAGLLDPDTAANAGIYARRLAAYAAARGVATLSGIDRDVAELYIHSPHARGIDGAPRPATLGTKHSRRSYVRQFFRVCRALGLDDRDPAADISLPPRQRRFVRPLTDDEVQRCKDASFRTTIETRLPCALALALSGATAGEAPRMTVDDVWPEHRRAWAHGGGTRAVPRWLALDDWAAEQIARRLDWLAANPPNAQEVDEGPRGLIYQPRLAARKDKQAVTDAILLVLRLAGLGDDPGVRPMSIQEWLAAKVYEQTGSVEHVAARLGMVSLDAAADVLGLDWTGLYDLDSPPGVDPPRRPRREVAR